MTKLNTGEQIRALTELETQVVSGGFVLPYYAAINAYVSPLDKYALNPQPLPPKALVAMF